jgi:hypothetical protein
MIIAWFELRHSGEANELRKIANTYRNERNTLQVELNGLQMGHNTLQAERNALLEERNAIQERANHLQEELGKKQVQHLGIMAELMKREPTKAERNAATLRKYLRKMAAVTKQGLESLGSAYELVELKDDTLTLFSPAANGASAIYRKVDCGDLTIDENPHGSCVVRINVVKYQGQPVDVGQVTRWEDRFGATPSFDKAPVAACNASYGKGGSAETRTLTVFQSKDGSNAFQLESSQGWTTVGDNVEISKAFMANQIDYFADNFTRNTFGPFAIQGGYKLHLS